MLAGTFQARSAVALTVMLLFTQAHAEGFSGTWQSTYGELRVHQTEGVIIGDYADVGILLGQVTGENCVSGIFTNGGRFGEFTFRIIENGQIKGRYRWSGGQSADVWDAERSSAATPTAFTNFTRTGGSTTHIANDAAIFSGRHASTYGQLNLRDSDLFLFGDYADRGVVAARWNGRFYEGVFTNRFLEGNQVGWLQWEADVLARDLRGGRYEIVGGDSGNWAVSTFEPGRSALQNLKVPGACAPMWPHSATTATADR